MPNYSDDAILLINKPKDWTSHDVVACVRGRFKIKKVGHCGTLDPLATGLLVVVTGKGTKLSQILSGDDKTYRAEMALGQETDSQDSTGKVTDEEPWEDVDEDFVREVLPRFEGEQQQIPPMYSALKKNGKKLYELARKGEEVEREPRDINVTDFEINDVSLPKITFTATCSKGTYIRTLCSDMGKALGTRAHMTELVRTRCGQFLLDNAFEMDEIKTWEKDDFYEHSLPLMDYLAAEAAKK